MVTRPAPRGKKDTSLNPTRPAELPTTPDAAPLDPRDLEKPPDRIGGSGHDPTRLTFGAF